MRNILIYNEYNVKCSAHFKSLHLFIYSSQLFQFPLHMYSQSVASILQKFIDVSRPKSVALSKTISEITLKVAKLTFNWMQESKYPMRDVEHIMIPVA